MSFHVAPYLMFDYGSVVYAIYSADGKVVSGSNVYEEALEEAERACTLLNLVVAMIEEDHNILRMLNDVLLQCGIEKLDEELGRKGE